VPHCLVFVVVCVKLLSTTQDSYIFVITWELF
jgi:ATP/ADP translocase